MHAARYLFTAAVLAAALALSACVGSNSSTIGRSAVNVAHESRAESGLKYTLGPQFESQLEQMISREVVALGGKESVPMELNRQVLLNINYFLNNGRGFMTRGLSRGSKYIPMMKAIFRQKGLPEDLVYLALIESGFKNDAVSHAAAVGPWQFIASTGRRYGLTINEWVDERMDPVKSTYAAADYLTTLHDMFNSWPLAIAAYNSGEGKIIKGMKNYGVSNFWDMSSVGGHLADETKLYVPSFLAVTFIAKDPAAYGLAIETQPPDQWDEVVVPAPVGLKEAAKFCGSTVDRLKELNPHLKKDSTPPEESNFVLRIPAGSTTQFAKAYDRSGKGATAYASAGSSGQHVVKSGETLASVAAIYGLEPSALRQYNKLSGDKLKAGTKLALPPSAVQVAANTSVSPRRTVQTIEASSSGSGPRLSTITHKVQAGDTLGSIAKLYGVSTEIIKKNNDLSSNLIKKGQILKIKSDLPLTAQKKTGGPVMVVESAKAPRGTTTHTVVAGDTLGSIAQKYGMSVRELADINNIAGVTIRVGQTLTVAGKVEEKSVSTAATAKPAATSPSSIHTVAAGESLGVIAEKYGMKTKDLMVLNDLADHKIRIGQKLKVAKTAGTTGGSQPSSPPNAVRPAPAEASPKSSETGVHVVAAGESLGVIAEKYGMKTKDLMTLNDLADHKIRIGQKLKVAGTTGASSGGRPSTPPDADRPATAAVSPKASESGVHVVAAGENVGVIAQKYGLKVKELMDLNGLSGPDIKIGQKLTVKAAKPASGGPTASSGTSISPKPAADEEKQRPVIKGQLSQPGTYKVAEGDTLYSIARKNDLSVEDLMKLNGLENNTLRLGQTLKLR